MDDSSPAASLPVSSLSPSYSDTQAMDDIQALLTSPSQSKGEATLDEVAEIVRRTKRSMATPRLMVVNHGTGKNGLPYAFIDAEGTVIRASQDPDTGTLRVTVEALNRLDEEQLRVDVNGQRVMLLPRDAKDTGTERPAPAEGGAW